MTVISSIDGPSRRIYLHADTVGSELNPVDIYREERALRVASNTYRKHTQMIRMGGSVPKGGGKFTERYGILINGARIIPFDTSQELTITGTLITDDGQEGAACFDRSTLSPSSVVDINYIPPQVEVIEVDTGGGECDTDGIIEALASTRSYNLSFNNNSYYLESIEEVSLRMHGFNRLSPNIQSISLEAQKQPELSTC